MPVVFFFAGVTYDTLTLNRIDRLLDNLILLLYLSVLGVLVVLTGRTQLRMIPSVQSEQEWSLLQVVNWARPYFSKALHFLFGGLFSAYTIFYFQSTSLTSTAAFLVVILALLIINEIHRTRRSSFKLLVSLYAIVTFSFFTFFLPVVTGRMNTFIFLIGAILSGVVVWRVVHLTFQGLPTASRRETFHTCLPAFSLILVLIGFYFLNWIPPVPLSLKFGGVYHQVERKENGYHLTFEKGKWYQFGKRSDDIISTGEPAYCFSAVFAPVALTTTVYHRWQYRPIEATEQFLTTDRIPIQISGGRKGGYRGYTVKQRLEPGKWRIDVEAEDGRVIGRMAFQVEKGESKDQELVTKVY